MAITNFIPTVWSENLYNALEKKYIGVANCNRDYEGEIKNIGSVVKICGVGKVIVDDYNKNTDIYSPQTLSDTVTELSINRAKFFNFQIDDIDKVQCSPKLMDAAMRAAAASIAEEADRHVYALYLEAGSKITHSDANDGKLLDTIIKARQTLYENNVTDSSEVVLEVTPGIASIILKEKLAMTGSAETFENGCIGYIAGCKVYVSNNIHTVVGTEVVSHKCIMRTKRAVTFADQISEINAYRPEKRFADAVKGLHLYGAKVVYPNEMVTLELAISKS